MKGCDGEGVELQQRIGITGSVQRFLLTLTVKRNKLGNNRQS